MVAGDPELVGLIYSGIVLCSVLVWSNGALVFG